MAGDGPGQPANSNC